MTEQAHITINGRRIGPDEPPYIIAEISANHNGSLERALELVDAAHAAGADAAKLQTYTADTMTIAHDGPGFTIEEGLWAGYTLHDLYSKAYTPWEWLEPLFERARRRGITLFSTPFDPSAVDVLEGLNTPAYKCASFEIVDIPLIEKMAATGKPMIISTGMADLGEIEEAVAAARGAGCRELAVLHCISGYPTPSEDANLLTIPHLAEMVDAPVGLSDHTMGVAVGAAAVALGASIIEKHFTLRRDEGGFDSAFSLEPEELKTLVEGARAAWAARGRVNYAREPSENAMLPLRRSLYVVADIAAGETLSAENVRSIRPGLGMPPKHLPEVLGRTARRALSKGTPLAWTDLE